MPASRPSRSSIATSVFYPSPTAHAEPSPLSRSLPSTSAASYLARRASIASASTVASTPSLATPGTAAAMPPLMSLGTNSPLGARPSAYSLASRKSLHSPSSTPPAAHAARAVPPALLHGAADSPALFEGNEFPFPIYAAYPTAQLEGFHLHTPSTASSRLSVTSLGSGSEPDVFVTPPPQSHAPTASNHLGVVLEEHMPFAAHAHLAGHATHAQHRASDPGAAAGMAGFALADAAPVSSPHKTRRPDLSLGPAAVPAAFWASSPRVQSPLASPRSPLSPLPFRQAAWLADRRASAPSLTASHPTRGVTFGVPSALQHPAPAAADPVLADLEDADALFPLSPGFLPADLFSPDYSMSSSATATPMPAPGYTFGVPFELSIDTTVLGRHQHASPAGIPLPPTPVTPATPVTPLTADTAASSLSYVAAAALAHHVFHPEFALRYTVGDELGHGGFGFVCVATQTGYYDGDMPGVEVAAKFIYKERFNSSYGVAVDGEPLESAILRQCDHPGIIRWHAIYEDSQFFCLELHGNPWEKGHTLEPVPPTPPTTARPKPKLTYSHSTPSIPTVKSGSPSVPTHHGTSLSSTPQHWAGSLDPSLLSPGIATPVRPYMGRRASHDLFECVEHARFSEPQARHVFRQIVDAVQYMHERRIYHRDLKDENCVIDRELRVKVIDFGSAVWEDASAPRVYHDFRGTSSYAPPEVLAGDSYQGGPCDVWALGIILAILLTGNSPFATQDDARHGIVRLRHRVPAAAEDLLRACLTTCEYSRPDISTVRAHPWLDGPTWTRHSI